MRLLLVVVLVAVVAVDVSQAQELQSMVGMLFKGGASKFSLSALSEDRCNATMPCNATRGEVCVTTPFGNSCRRREFVLCRQDADCAPEYACYLGGGATVGYCGGCTEDGDCRTSSRPMCYRVNITVPADVAKQYNLTPRFGHCAGCEADSDCAEQTQFCNVPERGSPDRTSRISMLMGMLTRMHAGQNRLSFVCEDRLAAGRRCRRDQQCASGTCMQPSIMRFFRRVCE